MIVGVTSYIMTCVLILFQSDLGHGSHWLCITSNTTDPTVTGRRASIQSTRSRLRAGRWPDRRGQCAADNAGRAWAVANRHRDHWLGRHMAGSEWRAQPRRARGPSALTWLQRNLRAPLERHRAGSVFKKLKTPKPCRCQQRAAEQGCKSGLPRQADLPVWSWNVAAPFECPQLLVAR